MSRLYSNLICGMHNRTAQIFNRKYGILLYKQRRFECNIRAPFLCRAVSEVFSSLLRTIQIHLATKNVKMYQMVFVFFILIGATMDLSLAWDLSDTFNGMMAIPNLIGVIALSGTVMKITRNYVDRKIKGKKITPMLSAIDEIQEQHVKEVS
ncbi:MAG: alanine:cation symporter family protein [Butyrivibrio sp.]|nr:alanine:cation symporter family protein [Butyrivibrio sp.]